MRMRARSKVRSGWSWVSNVVGRGFRIRDEGSDDEQDRDIRVEMMVGAQGSRAGGRASGQEEGRSKTED